jgi:alpha-1,2-mannosyltransferase
MPELTEVSPAAATRASRRVTVAAFATVAVLWLGLAAAVLAGVHGSGIGFLDLLVYRAGGHAVVSGHSLYAPDFASANGSPQGLSFTYPPFSALIFAPLAMVPAAVAKAVMTVLTLAGCAVLFAIVAAATRNRWDRFGSWRSLTAPMSTRVGATVVAAALVFMFSVPVLGNFTYGQVNVVLYAAVACDILLPRVWWPRGLLVGLAAAVKLTPAAFIGYFLITRQWRALAVSIVSAASAMGISGLVMPADTVEYFRTTLFDPARIGSLAFSSNQSLRGVIERLPALDAVRAPLWLLAVLLVLALAVAAVEASRRCGDAVAAMLSVGIAQLLCSPVSWAHHWVWLSATAVYLLMRWLATDDARVRRAAIAIAVIAIGAPWIFLPDNVERLWNPVQHVLGAVWPAAALAMLAWFATATARQAAR